MQERKAHQVTVERSLVIAKFTDHLTLGIPDTQTHARMHGQLYTRHSAGSIRVSVSLIRVTISLNECAEQKVSIYEKIKISCEQYSALEFQAAPAVTTEKGFAGANAESSVHNPLPICACF